VAWARHSVRRRRVEPAPGRTANARRRKWRALPRTVRLGATAGTASSSRWGTYWRRFVAGP